ncbi:MAG: VOC family protein [Propionibacterium sp.]|nr:VOC family protein [Propionibacterium sp.]
MEVLGLAWVGSSSPHLEEMDAFLRDGLGLKVVREQADARVFGFPDGSAFEIFKPSDSAHDFFEHPVAGILVADVAAARAQLEARGIEFIGEIHQGQDDSWSPQWSHFRAPDGYLYVLVTRRPEERPSLTRRFDELRFCLHVGVDEYETTVAQYRDGLGLTVVDDWTHPGGERGVLFEAVPAALEVFDGPQTEMVDRVEVGRNLERNHALRVEVADLEGLEALATTLEKAGATRHQVVNTPWEQTCLRMNMPHGEQLTISILPEQERVVRREHRARMNH